MDGTKGEVAGPLQREGIDSGDEFIVFLPDGDGSPGLPARTRVRICVGQGTACPREAYATVYVGRCDGAAGIGVSESLWHALAPRAGEWAMVKRTPPPASMAWVRATMHGHALPPEAMREVVRDIAARRYSPIETAAFVAASAHGNLASREVAALTHALIESGFRLAWPGRHAIDKHCIGGLPGNRTTPIVVAIAASLGITMPKASSRAITSAAGTADVMETMAPVVMDAARMRRVVEQENGCVVWSGGLGFAPADDRLIRAQRELDVNAPAHIVASVLAKKVACGASSVLIDIPVGPTAKVRTREEAEVLVDLFAQVADDVGLAVRTLVTDGTHPVGCGIGPALEARDVLAVLHGDAEAPTDLRERSVQVAAAVLMLSGRYTSEIAAREAANHALTSGMARARFEGICLAQGGMREPPRARCVQVVHATSNALVRGFDCRMLARLARLAGAPEFPEAGVRLRVRPGDRVEPGQPLLELHGPSMGSIESAAGYAAVQSDLVRLDHKEGAVV